MVEATLVEASFLPAQTPLDMEEEEYEVADWKKESYLRQKDQEEETDQR